MIKIRKNLMKSHSCELCEDVKTYSRRDKLTNHYKKVHSEWWKVHKRASKVKPGKICPNCQKKLKNERSLADHMSRERILEGRRIRKAHKKVARNDIYKSSETFRKQASKRPSKKAGSEKSPFEVKT